MRAITLTTEQTKVLDQMAERYQNKNFLACGDSGRKPRIKLFAIDENTFGVAQLLHHHLASRRLSTTVDSDGDFIIVNASCRVANRELKSFFATMRQTKAESEKNFAQRWG